MGAGGSGAASQYANKFYITAQNDGQITVTTNGNLGVGTDSPAYPLHVNGTLNAKDIIINANTNNLYVAVAYNSSIAATSTDGITWTQRSLPVYASWTSVTVNPVTGIFVAVAYYNSSIAATSTDGITWTQRSLSTR